MIVRKEYLYHCCCDHCKIWWNVTDIPIAKGKIMACPHCFQFNQVEDITTHEIESDRLPSPCTAELAQPTPDELTPKTREQWLQKFESAFVELIETDVTSYADSMKGGFYTSEILVPCDREISESEARRILDNGLQASKRNPIPATTTFDPYRNEAIEINGSAHEG